MIQRAISKNLIGGFILFSGLKISEIVYGFIFNLERSITNLEDALFKSIIDIFFIFLMLFIWYRFKIYFQIQRRQTSYSTIFLYFLIGLLFRIPDAIYALRWGNLFTYEDYKFFFIIQCFGALIEAPIVEEILFRGIFFVTLIRIHRFWGYISSNILFVLWHISFSKLFGDGIWTISPTYSLSLFISGLFASVLYEKTGDIKVPIVFHFCLNLIPKSAQLISYHFGLF